MPRTFIVFNPGSGRAAESSPILNRLDGQPRVTLRETSSADEATRLTAGAVRDGCDLIVAAGGDGTINSVANGIVDASHVSRQVTLAVLPLGTANDFARTLAIPDDPGEAAALIAGGARRTVDLIELETASQRRVFANVATGGNSDRVAEALTDDLKKTWGPLCYLRGAIPVLADLESYDLTVSLDEGAPLEAKIWNLIIANGRSNAGHLPVAPRANPEDGLLDLILVRDGSLGDLASLAGRFALSDYLESEQVIYRQVSSLTLQSRPRMRFSVDGEAIDEQPVAFRVQAAALRMIVGADYEAEPRG